MTELCVYLDLIRFHCHLIPLYHHLLGGCKGNSFPGEVFIKSDNHGKCLKRQWQQTGIQPKQIYFYLWLGESTWNYRGSNNGVSKLLLFFISSLFVIFPCFSKLSPSRLSPSLPVSNLFKHIFLIIFIHIYILGERWWHWKIRRNNIQSLWWWDK